MAGRQHGVVSRRQLLALGISRHDVAGRVERGLWQPLHRGVYAVGHLSLTTDGRWLAAVLACGTGAALSHRSAGQLWRLVRYSGTPEVTGPRSFKPVTGIRRHQAPLPADEVEAVDGIPVTSVSRTLVDLAALLDRPRLEKALNEAEVHRLTSRLSIPQVLERHPGRRGSAALRALLRDQMPAAGVTRNDFEARFRALIEAHGLPRPRFNADLALRGRFFEVDCLWSRRRLAVELDGREAHGTNRAFEKDRERDRVFLAEGWRVTRVTWHQLRDEPEAVIRDLRRQLGL